MPSIRRTLASISSTTRILAFRMSTALTMSCFGGEFERDSQGLHELVDSDWFCQVSEEASLETFFDVAWHGVGAEGDHGDMRGSRIFTKDVKGVDAADAREIDVHQDHVRQVGPRQLYAQVSFSGAQQADVGTARDQLLDEFQIRG